MTKKERVSRRVFISVSSCVGSCCVYTQGEVWSASGTGLHSCNSKIWKERRKKLETRKIQTGELPTICSTRPTQSAYLCFELVETETFRIGFCMDCIGTWHFFGRNIYSNSFLQPFRSNWHLFLDELKKIVWNISISHTATEFQLDLTWI
jgi:hypothetical protein